MPPLPAPVPPGGLPTWAKKFSWFCEASGLLALGLLPLVTCTQPAPQAVPIAPATLVLKLNATVPPATEREKEAYGTSEKLLSGLTWFEIEPPPEPV